VNLTKAGKGYMTFGKMQKPKNSKEPARVIWPLAKVKAIRTNESFLLQVPTKNLSLFINSVNSPSTNKHKDDDSSIIMQGNLL